MCIPAPLATKHKETDVATAPSNRSQNVIIRLTLVEWHTINWDDRVVGGVEYESWHLHVFNPVKARCSVVVPNYRLELRVYFYRELLINLAPSLRSTDSFHVKAEVLDHLRKLCLFCLAHFLVITADELAF